MESDGKLLLTCNFCTSPIQLTTGTTIREKMLAAMGAAFAPPAGIPAGCSWEDHTDICTPLCQPAAEEPEVEPEAEDPDDLAEAIRMSLMDAVEAGIKSPEEIYAGKLQLFEQRFAQRVATLGAFVAPEPPRSSQLYSQVLHTSLT
jgi:hypothetical protein